ncbi:MAG TPA: alpha/beta hydrolase [Alphaproteobacteria bacterium]|jgi:pimeloyl-ACP methyl ester carboxylesterase|nr:alpha/beta hydrolase [Alphaproteobacteria bacterium]
MAATRSRPRNHPIARTVVLGLAASALYTYYREIRDAWRRPPARRFVEVRGTRLHYIDIGAGPPVVLLHGTGGATADFETSGLAERLSRDHRVVIFDRPGYGYTRRPRGRRWTPQAQAALIAEACGQLLVQRPIVIGHSWGALVALALAISQPAAVRGLVLISGPYFPRLRADALAAVPLAVPIVGEILSRTVAPLIARFVAPRLVKKIFAPNSTPSRFDSEFPLQLAFRPSQLLAAADETLQTMTAPITLQRYYDEIEVPVALFAGAEDGMVDVNHALRLQERLPHSELHVLSGVGHMPHHFAVDELAETVERMAPSALPNAAAEGAKAERASHPH